MCRWAVMAALESFSGVHDSCRSSGGIFARHFRNLVSTISSFVDSYVRRSAMPRSWEAWNERWGY